MLLPVRTEIRQVKSEENKNYTTKWTFLGIQNTFLPKIWKAEFQKAEIR